MAAKRLRFFMRTAGERKDLAAKVQRLSIGSGFLNHLKLLQIRSLILQAAVDLGIDLMAAWRRRLVEASKDEIEAWTLKPPPLFYSRTGIRSEPDLLQKQWRECSRLRPRNADGIGRLLAELIAVLVKLLPNLNHLDLRANATAFLKPSSFKAWGISSLPNIRTLEIDEPANFLMNMATGVETMHLRGESDQQPHAPRPQELRNLKTLRVSETCYSLETFNEALSACSTDLRTFVYEAGGPVSCVKEGVTYTTFTAAGAAEALKTHRHTLETLHLDVSLAQYIYPPLEEQMSHFTLHDFTALRHILLSLGLLFGGITLYKTQVCSMTISSRLPPSVESLHLVSDPGQKKPVEQGLIGLAQTKERDPSRFPRLSYIGIAGGNLYICSKGVHEAMAAAGIKYGAEDWAQSPEALDQRIRYLRVSRTSQTALADSDRPFQRSDEPSDHQQVSGIASLIPSRPPACLPNIGIGGRSRFFTTQPRLDEQPENLHPFTIATASSTPITSICTYRITSIPHGRDHVCVVEKPQHVDYAGFLLAPSGARLTPPASSSNHHPHRRPRRQRLITDILLAAVPYPIAVSYVYHPQSPSHVVERPNTDSSSFKGPFLTSSPSRPSPSEARSSSILSQMHQLQPDTGTGSAERASLWETAMNKAKAKRAEEAAKDAAAKKAEEDEDARLRLEAVVRATRYNYIPKQTIAN
ncbi:hypothetical protein FDECE_14333 [Fusarium decemcellulare]|nr:hypothetical protein FDECE_14333 [Fusarium decemcellulare]